MATIRLPLDFEPREYQRPLWYALEDGVKRACVIAHRRWGKDLLMENWIACEAFKRPGIYWHVLPTYRQGRKVVWEGRDRTGRKFLDYFPEQAITRKRDDEMSIWFANGSLYQVIGADEPDRLVGSNPFGVVFSEWAIMDPKVWDLIRPILVENGGWAVFITTPRGRNHAYRMLKMAEQDPDWYAEVSGVDRTHAVPEAAIEAERRAGMPEELIQQEFFCAFEAPAQGSFFGDIMADLSAQKRFGRVPWIPDLPVITGWDLGMDDATAIWFAQRVGNEIHLIDYYESQGQELSAYAQVVQAKPYVYGDHIGPHDLAVRELGTGKSRLEMLHKLGIRIRANPRADFQDGIQVSRALLRQVWADEDKCEKGLEALREYTKTEIPGAEGPDGEPMYNGKQAKRNWATHGADAFRSLAMGYRRSVRRDPLPPTRIAMV